MKDTSNHNVVVLSEFERVRRGLSPAEGGLLNDCRDLASNRLSKALAAMLDKANDEFFDLAEKAPYRDMQNLYFEAMAQARDRRQLIETSFSRQFVTGFHRAAKGERSNAGASSALELSLVEPDDLEETLAISDIANKLRDVCGKELFALDKRIGVLLHDPELDHTDNPLSPETIASAFMEACQVMDSGVKIKLLFVMLFNKHMQSDIQSLYQEINQYLVEKGILPTIRVGLKKRNETSAANSGLNDFQALAAMAGSAARAPAHVAPIGEDVFAILQQLISRQGGGMGAPAGAGIGSIGAPGAGAPPLQIPVQTPEVVNALSAMQHGNPGVLFGDGAIPSGLAAGLAGSTNVLREIKTTRMAGSMGHIDAMTLDIVAMLFDYILDDRNIPDTMKALIGRLQIPVLKVAMLDKAFFSQKSHPARRLLDTLAEAALGWDADEDQDDRFYRKVDSVIQRILNDFDDDVGIFSEIIEDFTLFLAEEEKRAQELAVQSARVIHEKERAEIAAIMAREEIRKRLAVHHLPYVIRSFLSEWWEGVLRTTYAKKGEDSEAWRTVVGTMDDLIWSVEPKRTPEDRKRLVSLLPGLLKRLQSNMDGAAMPADARDEFFAKLVNCHTAAVKSGLQSDQIAAEDEQEADVDGDTALPPVLEAVTPAEEIMDFVPVELPAEPVHGTAETTPDFPESLDMAAPSTEELTISDVPWQGSLGESGDTFDYQVKGLKRGNWVEFHQDDGSVIRAKLAWISPLKGMYLFTNRLGAKAASITPQALASKFRNGTAHLLDEAPLLDRAVSSLVQGLSQNAVVR